MARNRGIFFASLPASDTFVFLLSRPMKKLALFLSFLLFLGPDVQAEKKKAAPTATPEFYSTATPAPTPAKVKKPGLFQRIFKKQPTPAPAPVPVATPSPTPAKKKRVKPTPRPEESAATVKPETAPESIPPAPAKAAASDTLPDSLPPLDETPQKPEPDSQETVVETPAPLSTPAPVSPEILSNPLNQPIPIIGEAGATPSAISIVPAAAELEQQALMRVQYKKLKTKALADKKVQELKAKTETATTPAERYEALKVYYPALFSKMRKLDDSQAEIIDSMEAAAKRRLERLQPDAPAE